MGELITFPDRMPVKNADGEIIEAIGVSEISVENAVTEAGIAAC